ncbi:MAG: hypothetical protein J1F13_03195 [Prevotellaceae bacterium]|nr:hypothetical protein [Prevotellaceae bacterium]
MKRKFNFKLFALCSVALAFAACSDDNYTGRTSGDDLTDVSTLKTASYLVGGGDQTRVANTGYWHSFSSRAASEYDYGWPKEISILEEDFCHPDNAKNIADVTNDDNNNPAVAYYVPAGTTVKDKNVPNNYNGSIYIEGTYEGSLGTGGACTIYVAKEGSLKLTGQNFNNAILYNKGTVEWVYGIDGVKINKVYNAGNIIINGSTPSNMDFYSKGGNIVITGSWVNFESNILCDHTILVTADNFKVQTGSTLKDICAIQATGTVEIVNDLIIGSIDANKIKFEGAKILLHPNGYVHAKEIEIPNSGCVIKAYDEQSPGVVKCDDVLTINLTNDKLHEAIGLGVYLETPRIFNTGQGYGDIDMATLEWVYGQNPNERMTLTTASGEGYINSGVSLSQPTCGAEVVEPDPLPNPDLSIPRLDLIIAVNPSIHDHDVDKTDEHRRHLSATSLTFDGDGNIYASYHMRGGNWAGDTYDKDDIEGCIERWSFDGENIEIGNWMWTNEFDFNHIILDGDKVITVGHKGGETEIEHNGKKYTDFGGIIGRMPTGVWEQNWDATDELKREDFEYKYLTTEVPLMGDFENESGNVTNQKVDYKSAGDGNCVVRAGDYYYVATSAGYGVVAATDSVFKRIKDETGKVLFTSTPGSAKYLVVNDDKTVNVLYLNDRAENGSEETTHFKATLAKITDFPSVVSTTTEMPEEVTPVDGKNVIAVDGEDVYACLSKGGLAKNGELFATFGEERSVNGVAIDDKYVYVANGSYITVLDKETAGVVVERKGNTKNVSANFVEVKDYNGQKYVFVAFGQDGIKVFKFTE